MANENGDDPVKVVMYCTDWCPFCIRAEKLLVSTGLPLERINVEEQPDKRLEMIERTGRKTVPQIFIGDHHVGGHDDLVVYLQKEQSLQSIR